MGYSAFVSKVLYKKLSVESFPPILYRQWSQVIGLGFSLDGHWSLVRDSFTENFKNDVIWLIILRGVNVLDSLFNWGVISSSQCASCPRHETIDHYFLNCGRVERVWSHFAPALSLVLGSQFAISLLTVFFLRWPSVSATRVRIARHLVKSILIRIWIFRNRATFQNGREDHRAIICYVRNDLKQRVILDSKRLSQSRFRDLWVLDGFCAVENGHPCVIVSLYI